MEFFNRKRGKKETTKKRSREPFYNPNNSSGSAVKPINTNSDFNKETEPGIIRIAPDKDLEGKSVEPIIIVDADKDKDKKTGSFGGYKHAFYTPITNKKLTVVLIENTATTKAEKDMISKIIKKLVPTGLITAITYGTKLYQCDICEISEFKDEEIFSCEEETNEDACLFDALVLLEKVCSDEYMKIKEKVADDGKKERVKVNNIEIIGIGTCKNSTSKVSKEAGIDAFCKLTEKSDIVTKYFCLTEETFVHAAEIGFHSIMAISREY